MKKNNSTFNSLIRTVSIALIFTILSTGNVFSLAPPSRLDQVQFREKFKAGKILFSHDAVNRYIKDMVSTILDVRGLEGLVSAKIPVDDHEVLVIPIPGLLNRTGQFAHIGLGRQYNNPVIYIDSDISPTDKEIVLEHEIGEISQWEVFRKDELGLERNEMRQWIVSNIDEAKNKSLEFHSNSRAIEELYERYSETEFDFEYISSLVSIYGYIDEVDINLGAAGTGGSDDLLSIDAANDANDIQTRSWIEREFPELEDKVIVTLSLEGNIPEFGDGVIRNANTKSGIGAYFGDKLEGLSSIGLKGYGIQPGYAYLKDNGSRIKVSYEGLIESGILEPIFIEDEALKIKSWGTNLQIEQTGHPETGSEVKIEVYRVNRGGSWNYILMSDLFDIVSPKDNFHRFQQEILFGKAAYELIHRLPERPDIVHLNGANTVVAAEYLRQDGRYDDTAIIYTNHSIVKKGEERLFHKGSESSAERLMYELNVPVKHLPEDLPSFLRADGTVDYAWAVMKYANVINAVSNEHAVAVERFFKELYGKKFDKKVIGILHGSGNSWKNRSLLIMEDRGEFPDDEQLWDIHEEAKKSRVYRFIHDQTGIELDAEKPTLWLDRRLVEYKSQYPMLRFLVHIITADREKTFTRQELEDLWMRDIPDITDEGLHHRVYNRDLDETIKHVLDGLFNGREDITGLGIQVVVGGSQVDPEWEKVFLNWTYGVSELYGKFIFIPGQDATLLKMQALGADLNLTVPRPLEEACGKNDQRTALNGTVNIAINGAGPSEWIIDYDVEKRSGNGFLLGAYTRDGPEGKISDLDLFYRQAPIDIFNKLGIASRLFYKDKILWRQLMHHAYMDSTYGTNEKEAITSRAMEQRYAQNIYTKALDEIANRLRSDGEISQSLKILLEKDHFNGNPISLRELVEERNRESESRGYSIDKMRVLTELRSLINIGLVNAESQGSAQTYYLTSMVETATAAALQKVIGLPALKRRSIASNQMQKVKLVVQEILIEADSDLVVDARSRERLKAFISSFLSHSKDAKRIVGLHRLGFMENPELAKYISSISSELLSFYALHEALFETTEVERHDISTVSFVRTVESPAIGDQILLSFINYGNRHRHISKIFKDVEWFEEEALYALSPEFRFTKDEGIQPLGETRYMTGAELKNLGIIGRLQAQQTVVYSIRKVDHLENIIPALTFSLQRFKGFERSKRVSHSFISKRILDALGHEDRENSFDLFYKDIVKLITIAREIDDMELGVVSTVLFDIAKIYPEYKEVIIDYLTRASLDEDLDMERELRYDINKVLRGMLVGEVVISALEARGMVGLGGLALYIRDIAKAFVDMGLDTTIISWIFSHDRKGHEVFDQIVKNSGLVFTGRTVEIEIDRLHPVVEEGFIYETMIEGVNAIGIAGSLADVLYGGVSNEDRAKRLAFFGKTLLSAMISSNIHPSVLHSNEVTGLAFAYLLNDEAFSSDPRLNSISTRLYIDHNLEPHYQGRLTSQSSEEKDILLNLLGFDPWKHRARELFDHDPDSFVINPTYIGGKTATDAGTVSPGYRESTVERSHSLGLGDLLQRLDAEGRSFGEQNGIDTAGWQKKLMRGQSFFDLASREERVSLFTRVQKDLKPAYKAKLQELYAPDGEGIGLLRDKNMFLITSMHRITDQKGYEISVPAIRKILEETDDIQFVVAGPVEDSEYGRKYFKEIKEMEVLYKGRFKYVGGVNPRQELYDLIYFGADAFLMPSKFEPAGLSQLEAIAAGTPTIARDVDGLKTSVIDVDQAKREGGTANGFKFFDYTAEELERTIRRAYDAFKGNEGAEISWDKLVYDSLTYDSRWIPSAKKYINGLFGKNSGVDIAHIVDVPELVLIFGEPAENLERTLIRFGHNTPRGLDYVIEDALEALKKHFYDERPLVRRLAKKYYEKHKDWNKKPEGILTPYGSIDTTKELFRIISPSEIKAEDRLYYEIRYDRDRLYESYPELVGEFSIEAIIEEFVKLLKIRTGDPDRIKLIPSPADGALISITSYEDSSRNDLMGKGVINIEGDLRGQLLNIISMLNITYAMSNIRFFVEPSEMNNHEKSLLRVVRDEIKKLTGIEVSDSYIRQYLRNLPHSKPVPLERIEEFNKLSKKMLMSA